MHEPKRLGSGAGWLPGGSEGSRRAGRVEYTEWARSGKMLAKGADKGVRRDSEGMGGHQGRKEHRYPAVKCINQPWVEAAAAAAAVAARGMDLMAGSEGSIIGQTSKICRGGLCPEGWNTSEGTEHAGQKSYRPLQVGLLLYRRVSSIAESVCASKGK